MKIIEYRCKCQSCKGTGIYSGMAETEGAGVVCYNCKGNGYRDVKIEYEDFINRDIKNEIEWVYETNCGIVVGHGNGHEYSDFGGMSYSDWLSGKKFVIGTEDRKYTCPAWWYQSANYDWKPEWEECFGVLGGFSRCKYFAEKSKCWDCWDIEHNKNEKRKNRCE